VISGASALRAAIHALATSRSSPRKSSDSGRPRLSQRVASSPSRVCSRIQLRSIRSASANSRSGRIMPVAVWKGMNCNLLNLGGISVSGTDLWITGKSRFESASVLSISQSQRSDFTAWGETTNTTVSDCSISPLSRASQGSPGLMSWRSRIGAKPRSLHQV
jgi:hypothetical protein